MTIVFGILFAIIASVLALSVLLGLPGIWMMIALAGIYDLMDVFFRPDEPLTFGWITFAIVLVLAVLSEIVEFAAGAAGALALASAISASVSTIRPMVSPTGAVLPAGINTAAK